MDRRTFLEASTLTAGGVLLKRGSDIGAFASVPLIEIADERMIGIQAGAISFVDEGTDKVLDGVRELADINTIFLATFTYGRGIAGRQIHGSAFPYDGYQE